MTNANPKISDEQLAAYVDGELDVQGVAEVEAILEEDPSLQQKIDGYKKSAGILKTAFSTEGQKTPDHILSRIDAIEKTAKKPVETKRPISFLENIYSYFQLQYAIPTFAAFAFGILLGPTLLGPRGSIGPSSGFPEDQIIIRGTNTSGIAELNDAAELVSGTDIAAYLNAQILQNGSSIENNGTIQAGLPFSVTLLAPLEGTATLREIVDGTESSVLDTQDSAIGRYVTFIAMQVDDQDSLSLRVALTNTDTQISYTLNFNVQN